MPNNLNQKSKLIPTRSYESLYSSASSKDVAKVLYHHKGAIGIKRFQKQQTQPQQGQQTKPEKVYSTLKAPTNKDDVKQSVLQKRFLRAKNFQSQLKDTERAVAKLVTENRMLRTLHQRQDVALIKYEAANEDLPKLLNSHAEEVRVWEVKCCNLESFLKDVEERLQKKEALIYALTDQNKYFSQLNKNKQLEERQNLNEELQDLEVQLADREKQMKQSEWRLQAELKHLKQVLTAEQKKVRRCVFKLEKSRIQLSGCGQKEKGKSVTQKLDFIKEDAELTEASVTEDTDTTLPRSDNSSSLAKSQVFAGRAGLSNLTRREQRPLGLQYKQHLERQRQPNQGVQKHISFQRPSETTLSEDISSIHSFDESAPHSVLTEEEGDVKRSCEADLNSCTSASSFNVANPTDGSITEEDTHTIEVIKSSLQLKREISGLRGKINADYKVREGFLDNYSVQASNNHASLQANECLEDNNLRNREEDTQTSLIGNASNMQFSKLLATLKTLDISKNE